MAPLSRYLITKQGFNTQRVGYFSCMNNTQAALQKIKSLSDQHPTASFIGHSLGGLLSCQALSETGHVGKVICLGSPLQGSLTARTLSQNPLGLGLRQHKDILSNGCLVLPPHTAQIAGIKPIGLGRVIAPLHKEDTHNDGTVMLSETRHKDLSAHTTVPVSHTGLIYSPLVWSQIVCFLNEGVFKD